MDLDDSSITDSRSASVSPVKSKAPSSASWGHITFTVDNPACSSVPVSVPFSLTKQSYTMGRAEGAFFSYSSWAFFNFHFKSDVAFLFLRM